jgi:hypothetical protein
MEGRRVLTMQRSVWDAMKPRLGERVLVEVRELPISKTARDAAVLAVNAVRPTSTGADVEVYRDDPKDAPCSVNVDRYAVIEDLTTHMDLPRMINAASTEDNANLRAYLAANIFFVKRNPGAGHHLPVLPAHVIVRSTST